MADGSGFSELTPNDLKDHTLTRLNSNLQRLWSKILNLYTGSPNINSAPTFTSVFVTKTAVPSDNQELLTLGSAQKLFGAARVSGATATTAGAKGITSVTTLPSGLGVAGTGALYCLTGPNHLYQWNGSIWQWGPGELGSRYCIIYPSGTPPAGEFHICDGSSQSVYNSDGSTASVTLPNYAGATLAGVSSPIYYRL
jgi:hypothetical protein